LFHDGSGRPVFPPRGDARPRSPHACLCACDPVRLDHSAHAQRTIQRSARLCYLCSSAVLHPDHRRPLSTSPHSSGSASPLPRRGLPATAGPVYAGSRCYRNFVADKQARVHGTRVNSGIAGSARVFSLAEERGYCRVNLFTTKPIARILRESEGGTHQLKRTLGPVNLVALGIGAIIGAGLFALTPQAAHENPAPAVIFSFIVAAIGCAFAGMCYSEFATMIPIAGSAYTYAYATMGEMLAWIIGWDLVLEYAVGAATVSVSWSSYGVKL